MFCCTLLYVHSSIAIILMGKRELIALLNLSSWCLVMVEQLFFAVSWGCLQFVIVIFPDHTHLLFLLQGNICEVQLHSFGIFQHTERSVPIGCKNWVSYLLSSRCTPVALGFKDI